MLLLCSHLLEDTHDEKTNGFHFTRACLNCRSCFSHASRSRERGSNALAPEPQALWRLHGTEQARHHEDDTRGNRREDVLRLLRRGGGRSEERRVGKEG